MGFLLSLFVPSLYILLIFHHSELLPVNLLFSVAGQRIQTPLPAYLELFTVMVAFDLLREAGTRMPTAIGTSLSPSAQSSPPVLRRCGTYQPDHRHHRRLDRSARSPFPTQIKFSDDDYQIHSCNHLSRLGSSGSHFALVMSLSIFQVSEAGVDYFAPGPLQQRRPERL